MNVHDEQRVVEALRTLTGGLTVTERDILESHGRLQSRLEPAAPRRRLMVLSAVAAAVVVAGAVALWVVDRDDNAGPEPVTPPDTPAKALAAALETDAYFTLDEDFLAGPAPTREALAGIWLLRGPYDPVTMVVNGEGYWLQGELSETTWAGPSTLVGDTWTRQAPGHPDCGDEGSLPWRAALADDGSLHLQFAGIRNTCTPADYREVWDRIGPESAIGEYLAAAGDAAGWRAPSAADWEGTYVSPKTGFVLHVAPDGGYSFYKDLTSRELVPADQGSTELEFRPGAISATCSGGRFAGTLEVSVAPAVGDDLHALPMVRITTSQDDCASGVAEQGVWVRVGFEVG